MSVTRCSMCSRGLAGYLDQEKELPNLTLDEVRTETAKYEAKEQRIRQYMNGLSAGIVTQETYPDGRACPGCGFGWREFKRRRKD